MGAIKKHGSFTLECVAAQAAEGGASFPESKWSEGIKLLGWASQHAKLSISSQKLWFIWYPICEIGCRKIMENYFLATSQEGCTST